MGKKRAVRIRKKGDGLVVRISVEKGDLKESERTNSFRILAAAFNKLRGRMALEQDLVNLEALKTRTQTLEEEGALEIENEE